MNSTHVRIVIEQFYNNVLGWVNPGPSAANSPFSDAIGHVEKFVPGEGAAVVVAETGYG